MENDQRFRQLLDQHYQWPAKYCFKFVVLAEKVEQLLALVGTGEVSQRPSKNGKYASVSIIIMASSSEEVLQIYGRASSLEGLISL